MAPRSRLERLADRLTGLLVGDGVAMAAWLRYLLTTAVISVAMTIRLHILAVDGRFVFFTLYPGVIICALVFGADAGVLAIALSAAGALYFLMAPFESFSAPADSVSALLVYVVCCLAICALVHLLRRAATRFQRGQQVFRSLYDTVEVGVVLTDLSGRFIEANPAYQRLSGYTIGELQELDLVALTLPEGRDVEMQQLELLMQTGHCGPFEKVLVRKDGSRATLRASGSRITLPDGGEAMWGLARDITEPRRIAAALQDNEARLRGIFSALSEGLVVQRADGSIIDANPAAERILALTRAQLLGKTSLDPAWQAVRENGTPMPGEEHPAMVTLRTGEPLRYQIMGVRVGAGATRWISINTQLLDSGDGPQSAVVVATFADITGQRESYRRIRELALRVDAVREEERRTVAQLLHEGIAQDLFAARLRLRQLVAKARVGDGTAQACAEVGDALDKCMDATRQMANSLRPAALSHMQLPKAIAEHARYIGELTGLKISVSELAPFPPLKDAVQLAFFRSAQELLSNVVRHARATSVAILLDADSSSIRMEIVDDGVGVDIDQVESSGGLGLLGIRERFAALGGELDLRRNPGSGTTASVRLPRPGPAVRLVS